MRLPSQRPASLDLRVSSLAGGRYTGLTLVEVMISTLILALVTLGVLSTLLSTRQMADFTRKQLLVDTAVQGVLEQLKNRKPGELLPVPTPTDPALTPAWFTSMTALKAYLSVSGHKKLTVKVDLDNDPSNALTELIISPYDPTKFDPAKILPGAVPVDSDTDGYGDLDGKDTDDVGVNVLTLDVRGTTGLNGSQANTADDLKVNLMVFITDASQVSDPLLVISRQILIYYTWTYKEARVTRKIVDKVQAIRTPL